MASFVPFSISPIAVACFLLLVKSGLSTILQETTDPPTTNDYAPRPLSSYESYLRDCSSHLNPSCGKDIFFSIFVGNQTINDGCCYCLVYSVGKQCHQDMTRYSLSLPDYKYTKMLIWRRSEKVWDYCVSFLSNISPVKSIELENL